MRWAEGVASFANFKCHILQSTWEDNKKSYQLDGLQHLDLLHQPLRHQN